MPRYRPFECILTPFWDGPLPPHLQPHGACHLEMLRLDQEPSLRAKCQIPDGWPAFRLTVDEPLGEAGYSVSCYGHLITQAAALQEAPTVRLFGSPDIITIVALQRCVYHTKTPVWLEALWDQQEGGRISMHGLEHLRVLDEVDIIRHGLVMLRRMETGRRRGTPTMTHEEFHAAYPAAYREASRRRARPTDADMVRALPISLPTFKRYLGYPYNRCRKSRFH